MTVGDRDAQPGGRIDLVGFVDPPEIAMLDKIAGANGGLRTKQQHKADHQHRQGQHRRALPSRQAIKAG